MSPIEHALERGLRYRALSDAALARLRGHVLAQFRLVTAAHRGRFRRTIGIAAALCVVLGAAGESRWPERASEITQGTYPPWGEDWAWVEDTAPPYDIENGRLADFLMWVARETGRRVSFLDTRARLVAERTTLHGSVAGLRPLEALAQVIATTSLRYEVVGGEIRVSSKP